MIFGNLSPQIEDINSGEIVDLVHSVMDPDFVLPNLVEHESVINHYRSVSVLAPPHAEFRLSVNLFKYNNPGSVYFKLYGYLGKAVWFYPHKDNSLKIKCYVADIKPYYLEQPSYYDVCDVVFKSLEPVQYVEETFTSILTDKDDNPVVDKDGNAIDIKIGPELFREEPAGDGGAETI